MGPSLALADTFVSMHPATTVGLIPCAKGSSSISDWQKTDSTNQRSTLYGSCMTRMKMVSPANGTIRAVIFWQGGEDAETEKNALKWKERFATFVADLRADLGDPNLPVIMIMVALHDKGAVKDHPYWEIVREQQRTVNIPGVIKFDSDGYERKLDGVHFHHQGPAGHWSCACAFIARSRFEFFFVNNHPCILSKMIFAIDDISEHHVVPVSRDTRSASRAAERCTDIGVRLLHAIKHEDLLVGEVGRAFECDVIPISRNVWVSLELHIRVIELCIAVATSVMAMTPCVVCP